MKITIRQKNLEITSALQEYIVRKVINPVEKFLKRNMTRDAPILDIEMSRTTKHHRKGQVYRASAGLTLGKTVLHAEAEDRDIHAACDSLENELKREIDGFKSKISAVSRRKARAVKRDTRYSAGARIRQKGRAFNEGD